MDKEELQERLAKEEMNRKKDRLTYEEIVARGDTHIVLSMKIHIPLPKHKEYVDNLMYRFTPKVGRMLREEFEDADNYGRTVIIEDISGRTLIMDAQ